MENGITSDYQIDAGLVKARAHNSPFLPSIGQFVEWCKEATGEKNPPLEACYAELLQFLAANRKDKHSLTPILYHTITKNMDFYRFKQIERDYDRTKAFEVAHKATLFQLECGESLVKPPAPETLLEDNSTASRHDTPKAAIVAKETLGGLMAMLDDKPEQKPLTPAEIADQQRLEAIKNGQ